MSTFERSAARFARTASGLLAIHLATRTGDYNGQPIHIVGSTARGDGGGGTVYWDTSTPLPAANGGTIFGTTSAGRWIRTQDGDVNVKWFGAKGNWDPVHSTGTDDTAAIAAAITAGLGRTLYFPDGVYKTTSTLNFTNVGIRGTSVRGGVAAAGGVEIAYYGTSGYAVVMQCSYGGTSWRRFRIKSYGTNQSGACCVGEGPVVENLWIEGFDRVSWRCGTGSLGTVYDTPAGIPAIGTYHGVFTNVSAYNYTTSTNALVGIFNDQGFPSTNANTYINPQVKGQFDVLDDIGGTSNYLIGGDYIPVDAIAPATAVHKIRGINCHIHGHYFEVPVGSSGSHVYHFTSTSIACSVKNPHVQVGTAVPNFSARVLDEGWGNDVEALPIGYNYPFPQSNVSAQNLVINSHFKSWNAAGTLPSGWASLLGGTPAWSQVAGTLSAPYSAKCTLIAQRCNLQCSVSGTGSTGQVPITDLQNRTIVAAVWCKSSVVGIGNLKITGAAVGAVGQNTHTGSGNWELLTAFSRVDAAATSVGIQLRSDTDGVSRTGDVEFSAPVLFIGKKLGKEEPRPLTDANAMCFGRFSFAPTKTFVDGDTTPSVLDGNIYKATNTAATTITAFDDWVDGQPLWVKPTNGNTTIASNANIQTTTGAAKLLTSGVMYHFMHDDGKWIER